MGASRQGNICIHRQVNRRTGRNVKILASRQVGRWTGEVNL